MSYFENNTLSNFVMVSLKPVLFIKNILIINKRALF